MTIPTPDSTALHNASRSSDPARVSEPADPFAEHTARLARELATALVTERDTAALAAQVADIAEKLAAAAAAPHSVVVDDPLRMPNHIIDDITPATSPRNPLAPPMHIVADDDGFRCDLTLPLQYQGPPGRVHGGAVALLLDHILGHTANQGAPQRSFTRSLTIHYDAGTPIGEPITLRGRIARTDGRKKFMEAQIICDGVVRVRAEGLWLSPRPSAA